ncbi:cytochrome P450 [Coprinopsis cinerea AmutBmut pab1-1]|nr:cytochrome P450 [Coprinopsis cinerea AmutBmut pab1-1]
MALLLIIEAVAALAVARVLTRWFQRKLAYYRCPGTSIENIPGPPSKSFWIGNFKDLFRPDAWDFHRDIAQTYGGVVRLTGPLGTQRSQLYVYDPKALHHIVVKEQHVYEEALNFIQGNLTVFGPGLLSTLGDHHRRQRKMLNPVFSIAHMRGMVPIFWEVASKVRATFQRKVANGPVEIEMHHWITRTALELIGQSGLGWTFDTLTEDEHTTHPFHVALKSFGATIQRLLFWRIYIYPLVYWIGTPKFQRRLVDWLPWKDLHDLRNMTDVLHNTSVEIFETKKKALLQGEEAMAKEVGRGKDIISVLMAANMNASEEDRLPDEEVLGQISTFTFAAADTTSGALLRILWLLCKHRDVQSKLREEIREARKNNRYLDYDELASLPYLDAVCRETLRLYPPVSTLMRECRADSVLPLSKPVRGLDGSEMTEVLVPKDTRIYLSIFSCNRSPELWGPDVFEWKPDRWLSPLPESLTQAKIPGIYSHLMTFLGGGRACIGFKFSQLEMKVVLCELLEHFEFSLPKDKEITWRMPGIAKPYVTTDGKSPQLPLIVSPVE